MVVTLVALLVLLLTALHLVAVLQSAMGLCRGLTTFETLSLTTFGPGFIEAGWG
jgi:hypothetical protein